MADDDIQITITEPYAGMMEELRDEHGDEIDAHIRDLIRDSIHESYQQTR
jgi:hypothetical protein